MAKLYHLDLEKKALRGALVALVPGDPDRVELIAGAIASAYGTSWEPVASKREFRTCLAYVGKSPVAVTSTGIGGPSTSIAVEELAVAGVRSFVRVGTTGSIQDHVKDGDCVITTGAVRLDGASTHYAPIEFPAVADHAMVAALIKGAEEAGVRYHTGVTASSATFYPGEERRDGYGRHVLRAFRGSTGEWRALGVLNYEMEAATLFTMTASMGLAGGCVTGVINRGSTGRITKTSLKKGQENAIRAAVAALSFMV